MADTLDYKSSLRCPFLLGGDKVKFRIHSLKKYGQPKLEKPKELSAIKQAFSIDYIPRKCSCQVFTKGEDVWIKHKDYFSETYEPTMEELGMPLNYYAEKFLGKDRPKKFAYEDAWGAVVLRNEAWIVIEGLMKEIKSGRFQLDIVREIREQQERLHGFEKYELVSTDMERFWEKLVYTLKKGDDARC